MTPTKAELAASSLQEVLNRYYQSNAENVRYRSETASQRVKIHSLETLLDQKEKRLILLTELLSRRGGQPTLRSPEQTLIEAEAVT